MNKDIKILLAEDDKNLGVILKNYLVAKGYQTELFVNGQLAWEAFEKDSFSFCIVDVMMPVMDGFTLGKNIREKNKDIPLLFLTAKSLQQDKLKGFTIGADDYLTKPFSMEELTARITAILRRSGDTTIDENKTFFKIGSLEFDYNRQILKSEEKESKLTSKESDLLKLLAQNANKVLDRGDALMKIWKDDSYFNARSMDVYIAKIRKYLKQDPNIQLINVHGIGFKLVCEVR
ncbi:MAG: response regulator transcription factor [Bacteroidota bacterium]|nr:response regulator transcription factor [Bacteroidota bacterium]